MSIIHPNSLAEPLVYCPAVQPVNLSLYTTNKTHSMGSSRGDISKKDHIIQKMLRGVAGSRGEGMLAWIQRSCKDESWVRASGSHCNWFPCAAKTFNTFRLPIPVVHFNILLWYHHSPFQSCQHDPNIVEYVAGLRNSERNHRTTAKKCSPLWFWLANKDVLSLDMCCTLSETENLSIVRWVLKSRTWETAAYQLGFLVDCCQQLTTPGTHNGHRVAYNIGPY